MLANDSLLADPPATEHPAFDVREIRSREARQLALNLSPVVGTAPAQRHRAPRLAPQRVPRRPGGAAGRGGPRGAVGTRWGRPTRRGSSGGPPTADGSRPPSPAPTPSGSAGRGWGCGSTSRPPPDAVQGHLPVHCDPVDGATCSPPTRPAAATASPSLRGERSPGSGPRRRRAVVSRCRRRQPWEIAVEEATRAGARRGRPSTRSSPRAAPFAAFLDAVAPGARPPRPPNWPRTCCGRRRSPRRASHARGAHVQALDGQGLELGPLLQRPRPGAGAPRWPGTSSSLPFDHQDETGALPDSVTHSEVLYNYVKPPSTAGLCGLLRHGSPTARPRRTGEAYDRLVRWTGSGSTAARARRRFAPLPARKRQRLGQLDDLRRRTGWSRPPTWPRSSSCNCDELADLADELGPPDEPRGRGIGGRLHAAMLDQLWPGTGSSPVALTGSARTSDQPARPDADRPRRRLPASVRAALAARIEAHLTAHGLATELPDLTALPRRRLLARPDLGARPPSSSRTACAAAGHAGLADEISARFRALCERTGSPRTSTPSPAPACATAPTPGPPAATSSSPRPLRSRHLTKSSHSCQGKAVGARQRSRPFWTT